MKGNIRTTGISRFNNKFKFGAPEPYNGNNFIFTLTPLPDTDYNFFVDFKGVSCPTLLAKESLDNGCKLTLDYNGTAQIKLGSKIVNFDVSDQAIENINYGKYELLVNNNPCLIINCEKVNEVTQVILETPNFNLIPDSAIDVLGDLALFNNLNKTINTVNQLVKQFDNAKNQMKNIELALSLLNFNVTEKYDFKNFTDLRAELDGLIKQLETMKGDEKLNLFEHCDSVFGSIKCFFEDLIANLIIIGIVIVAVIIAYILIFKLKVCKGCCKKK